MTPEPMLLFKRSSFQSRWLSVTSPPPPGFTATAPPPPGPLVMANSTPSPQSGVV